MAPPGSEPESPVSLPQAEPSDSAEVARSLKLANMLWEEGQKREAVRALQRGAAAAEEDGNDKRALTLARSAADLAAHLPPSIPPPATTSAPPPPVAPIDGAPDTSPDPPLVITVEEPAPSSNSELSVPIVVTSPISDAAPETPAVTGPVTPVAATPAAPAVQPLSVRPAASIATPKPSATPGPVSTPKPSATPGPISTPSPPRVAPMGRVLTPSVAPEKLPSKLPHAGHATNGAAAFSFPVTARELRVAVKRSALDETLLVVRPLAPGAKPPAGSREAVLVFSDVDGE